MTIFMRNAYIIHQRIPMSVRHLTSRFLTGLIAVIECGLRSRGMMWYYGPKTIRIGKTRERRIFFTGYRPRTTKMIKRRVETRFVSSWSGGRRIALYRASIIDRRTSSRPVAGILNISIPYSRRNDNIITDIN